VQIRTSQVRQDLRGVHRGERVSADPCPLRFLRPLRAPRVTLFQSDLSLFPLTGCKKWGKSTPSVVDTLRRRLYTTGLSPLPGSPVEPLPVRRRGVQHGRAARPDAATRPCLGRQEHRSRSSGVERFLGKEEVMGSIPIASSLDCDRTRAGGGPGRRPVVGR
jgi:hypothetical protein